MDGGGRDTVEIRWREGRERTEGRGQGEGVRRTGEGEGEGGGVVGVGERNICVHFFTRMNTFQPYTGGEREERRRGRRAWKRKEGRTERVWRKDSGGEGG